MSVSTLIDNGVARGSAGDFNGALTAFRRGLAVDPGSPMACIRLSEVLLARVSAEGARTWVERAVALLPGWEAGLFMRSRVFRRCGRDAQRGGAAAESILYYRHSLCLGPAADDVLWDLALASRTVGRLVEAEAALRRALAVRPDVDTRIEIGNVRKDRGRIASARSWYRSALALAPAHDKGLNNLANVYRDAGELALSREAYGRALAIEASAAETESNLLQSLQFDPTFSDERMRIAHERWNARHAAGLRAPLPIPRARYDQRRKLRVGFVSADFARHPVGHLVLPALLHRDPSVAAVVCYSNRSTSDEVTSRIRASVDEWNPVQELSDDALADAVRRDEIDILVDLSGHTAGHRLLVFARKPAPVQVTWLGYFDTTGIAAIDYVFTDEFETPRGSEHHFVEKVIRLEAGRFCYEPPSYAPPVSDAPVGRLGTFTFGCFNNIAKMTSDTISLWSRILRATGPTRLVLKWASLGDPEVAASVRAKFRGAGVPEDRLELRGWSTHDAMLAEYGDVDVALDPFPFSGCMTSLEALWMGVPVVTLQGRRPVGRQSAAILARVGLLDFVAHDADAYVRLATSLVERPKRLGLVRATLRERMLKSSLCDGPRFARTLEAALRHVWVRRCELEGEGAST
jgi:protein O-GlcNAc transferase